MKHFDDFELILKRLRKTADVICFSETGLNEQNVNICHLSGYNGYFCNSKTGASESAIYFFEKLQCQHLPQIKIKLDGCEDAWTELQLDNQESLIVGAVYWHPNDNKNGFKMFEEAFVKANQNFVVERDFNIN